MVLVLLMIIFHVSAEVISEEKRAESRSIKLSIGYHLVLPFIGLALAILGRKQIFEKVLLQLDRKYLTILCPSFIKRENVLKWACTRLPPTWSSNSIETLSGGIKELWTDGSLLCTLVNAAIPGACPNPHRHWKQPPTHAQALAYKYFGITPVFSNEDFVRPLTLSLERKFIYYLSDVQQSAIKAAENVEKPGKFSSRYMVRGMGLFSGEQHKKATFYIYLNEHYEGEEDEDGTVIIQIKGPYGNYGEVITPKLENKTRKTRNKRKQERRSSIQFIENLMQPNTWNFARLSRKNINEGIEIETAVEKDRIKVSYVPKAYGMFEINMITKGELIIGCPFNVHIFVNDGVLETKASVKPQRVIKPKGLPDLIENECNESDDNKLKPIFKSTFNFKEVVDEITKNGTIYRDILGHTPETETTRLEISVKNKEDVDEDVCYLQEDSVDFFDGKTNSDEIINCEDKFVYCSNNSKINNVKNGPECTDKKAINETDKQGLGHKQNDFVLGSKYVSKVNVKKIKIPDKFAENTPAYKDKYFKNLLNESNRQKCNNNRIEFEKIRSKFDKVGSLDKNTSPICTNHIDTEVNFYTKTLAQKRKVFLQKSKSDSFNTQVSSFSQENEKEFEKSTGFGILNIVNNLQEPPIYSSIESNETFSICSTLSLPNVSIDSDYSSLSIEDRKAFWESFLSNESTPQKNIYNKNMNNNKHNFYKSADDILSITKPNKNDYNRFNSVEDLNTCGLLSIKERKQLLSKSFEKEKNCYVTAKKISPVNRMHNSDNKTREKPIEKEYFTPISEKIKKYKSALELSTQKVSKVITPKVTPEIYIITHHYEPKTINRKALSSKFKKAINYFQNLETQSQKKPKKEKKKAIIGGSLNVAQKFSIKNLYQDVFGNKKGVFKGRPNNSALVEALATFSRNPNQWDEDEDDIEYEIFKCFIKNKKRKSLKNIFDVHY